MSKTDEELLAVFQDFDKDGNGYLDASEIVVAAGQLGLKVEKSELEAVFKKVDKNFDGKISFEEFKCWWKMGGSNKLEALVYLKLKSLNLLKRANVMHERLGGLLENKYGDVDVRNVHLGVQVGEPEEKTVSSMQVNFNNDDVKKHFDCFTKGLEDVSAEKITVVLELASENPEDAKDELQEKVEEVMVMLEQVPQIAAVMKDVAVSFGCSDKMVKVGVTCNVPMVQDMVNMAKSQVQMMLGDKVSLTVKGRSVLGTDVATVLESTVAKVYPALKCEMDACLAGQAVKNLVAGLLQKLDDKTRSYKHPKYLAMSLGFLMRGGKFQLNLNKVDLDEAMQQSPLGQMKDMQVKQLLASVAPMAQGMMMQAPPLVKDFLEVFKENFTAHMRLMAYVPTLCVVSECKTTGVADLYNLVFPNA